ncbi:MAG: hypothetical protein FWE22_07625 [Firmicutes bacterium]|nr:hypothetical protein [Bacillota bacterium]
MNSQFDNNNGWNNHNNNNRPDPFDSYNKPNFDQYNQTFGHIQKQTAARPVPTAFGTVSIVVALISMALSILFFVLGLANPRNFLLYSFFLGMCINFFILSIVMGNIQLGFIKKRDPSHPKGKAIAGITISGIFLALSVVFMITVMVIAILSYI